MEKTAPFVGPMEFRAQRLGEHPRPGLRQPSAGYTFAWTGLLGSGATGIRQKRFRMEALESTRIEGEMAFVQKVVAPELGYLFEDTVLT